MPSRNSARGHNYNLVQSDDLDTRVPLLPDEAFQNGIQFNCKYIGSMDIPRPTSRVEIVAAMRRVRFEFKQKGIKKKKATVTISVNGIKTTLRKRKTKKRRIGRNKDVYVDVENSLLIESHPIYRIFYVSHDSQDVKIFSYIARETSTNVFHCVVFKATKKAQAMRIVRTVGQAFEVCHKLVGAPDEDNNVDGDDGNYHPEKVTKEHDFDSVPSSPVKRGGSLEEKHTSRAQKLFSKLGGGHRRSSDHDHHSSSDKEKMKIIEEGVATKVNVNPNQKPQQGQQNNQNSPEEKGGESNNLNEGRGRSRPGDLNLANEQNKEQREDDLVNLSTPVTPTLIQQQQAQMQLQMSQQGYSQQPPSPARRGGAGGVFHFGSQNEVWLSQQNSNNSSMAAVHEAHLLREKLEQQQQQTQAALAQINLLRDQLAAESAARIEAQARTHQLLLHNKELLDHLQSLVRHIQELEGRINQSGSSLNNSPAPALPQLTPRSKIERWFQYAALMSEEEAAKQQAGVGGGHATPTEDDLEEDPEDLLYLEDDDENHPDHVHAHHHLGQRGKVNRESKRTLVSKGESGFVSENTLNSASNLQKRGKYFNFSSSSIFRRVLRLGPRNRNRDEGRTAVVVAPVTFGPGRVTSTSKQNSKNNKSSKKRKFGRGRRARRADLEAAILRSGQGIGNKSFLGSSSTVHQNNLGLKRSGVLNSSGKSRVSSL